MRYSGKLGLTKQTEVRPGFWEDVVTEVPVRGTVEIKSETLTIGDQILPRAGTSTSVSLLSRGAKVQDNSDIAYITYSGKRWVPQSITTDYPRITVFLGEEYHGPVPD